MTNGYPTKHLVRPRRRERNLFKNILRQCVVVVVVVVLVLGLVLSLIGSQRTVTIRSQWPILSALLYKIRIWLTTAWLLPSSRQDNSLAASSAHTEQFSFNMYLRIHIYCNNLEFNSTRNLQYLLSIGNRISIFGNTSMNFCFNIVNCDTFVDLNNKKTRGWHIPRN